MTIQDDLRTLAAIDTRHRRLRHAPDSSLAHLALDVQRDRQGQPVVAVGLVAETCPVDATATYRIKYWLGDTTRRSLIGALTRSSLAVIADMQSRGEQKIWGAVPKNATHLVTFLDRVVEAGLCRRVDADEQPDDTGDPNPYPGHWYYIADREEAREFMRR